jgi:hypothetical protein
MTGKFDDDAKEWLTKELDKCETAYREGVVTALIDALWICNEMPAITPHWALAASQEEILKGFVRSAKGGKGRTANPVAKFRADMVHYERWLNVLYARRKQAGRSLGGGNNPLGTTWDDAFRWASVHLRGTFAQGEPGAIKDSCQLVEHEIKAGNSSRFRTPLSPTLLNVVEQKSG